MNIESVLEANTKFAETSKPGVRAFDTPSMPSEPLVAFRTAAGDTSLDATLLQMKPAACYVIAFICMQLARMFGGWPLKPSTAGMAFSVSSNAIGS